jgi:hypothetical protein
MTKSYYLCRKYTDVGMVSERSRLGNILVFHLLVDLTACEEEGQNLGSDVLDEAS